MACTVSSAYCKQLDDWYYNQPDGTYCSPPVDDYWFFVLDITDQSWFVNAAWFQIRVADKTGHEYTNGTDAY